MFRNERGEIFFDDFNKGKSLLNIKKNEENETFVEKHTIGNKLRTFAQVQEVKVVFCALVFARKCFVTPKESKHMPQKE